LTNNKEIILDMRMYYIIIELNLCGVRPPENRVVISGDTTKELHVKLEPSYADNVLVVGPRYQIQDFKCIWTTHLGKRVSGVCGMTIFNVYYLPIMVVIQF